MPPMEFADESEGSRAHDFRDDGVRAQSSDGSEGGGHAAGRTTHFQPGSIVNPETRCKAHERIAVHHKDLGARRRRVSFRFPAHIQIPVS
jgi:hypothetical protein